MIFSRTCSIRYTQLKHWMCFNLWSLLSKVHYFICFVFYFFLIWFFSASVSCCFLLIHFYISLPDKSLLMSQIKLQMVPFLHKAFLDSGVEKKLVTSSTLIQNVWHIQLSQNTRCPTLITLTSLYLSVLLNFSRNRWFILILTTISTNSWTHMYTKLISAKLTR